MSSLEVQTSSVTNLKPAVQRLLSVGIVVPTYREVENIPHLVERVSKLRESMAKEWNLQLLLMDDNSNDGSEALVKSLGHPWVQIVVRTADRGLSLAVLDGLRRLQSDILVVMDADLSHPPEKIVELVAALQDKADFAVGSRFVKGGSTDDDWGFARWLNSRVATLLAMPLTTLKDPMSGFFALRRETFAAGRDFNPVGYKIGLELVIKCNCKHVSEVPIHFNDRRYGESKLSFKEQLKYLQHIRRLFIYKYGNWSYLTQFLVVGLSGAFVNIGLLTLLLAAGLSNKAAIALAIGISLVWNFILNRRFTFSYARGQSIVKQFIGFASTCSIGALANYFVTLVIWQSFSYKQVAAAIGILAGTIFNFIGSRYLVFRRQHYVPTNETDKG